MMISRRRLMVKFDACTLENAQLSNGRSLVCSHQMSPSSMLRPCRTLRNLVAPSLRLRMKKSWLSRLPVRQSLKLLRLGCRHSPVTGSNP